MSSQAILGLNPFGAGDASATPSNDVDASSSFDAVGLRDDYVGRTITAPPPAIFANSAPSQGCRTNGTRSIAQDTASFYISGRGGIPLSPYEAIRSTTTLTPSWITTNSESPSTPTVGQADSTIENAGRSAIIEATSWKQDPNGNIQLIARSTPSQFPNYACMTHPSS